MTDYAARFEVVAKLYRFRTGRLRPGQSAPPETGEDPMSLENQERFTQWLVTQGWNDAVDMLARLDTLRREDGAWHPPSPPEHRFQCLMLRMSENWKLVDGKRVKEPDFGPFWEHVEYLEEDVDVDYHRAAGWYTLGGDSQPIEVEHIKGFAPLPEVSP